MGFLSTTAQPIRGLQGAQGRPPWKNSFCVLSQLEEELLSRTLKNVLSGVLSVSEHCYNFVKYALELKGFKVNSKPEANFTHIIPSVFPAAAHAWVGGGGGGDTFTFSPQKKF